MGTRWRIRRAETEDAGALRRCMEASYTPYVEQLRGVRLPPMDLDYADEIQHYPTWVAVADGEAVGGMTMMFTDDHASIANVAVHPEYQGQGLGQALMRLAEEEAVERGYTEIRLATHVQLVDNVAVYRHLGWKELNRDNKRVYMVKTVG